MDTKNLYGAILSAMLMTAPATTFATTSCHDDGQGDISDTMNGPKVAKNGADDAPGDISGEGAGHPVLLARNGADDVIVEGAGHPVLLARNGADDVIVEGAGHPVLLARNGADDVVVEGAGHPIA